MMLKRYCSIVVVAMIVAGCGDRSGESKGAAEAAPAARAGSGATAAAAAAVPAGGGEKAATTQRISTTRPTIERAEVAAEPEALQLNIELGCDNPYIGEPVAVRLYLSSPQAEAANDAAGAKAAAGGAARNPLSNVSAEWANAVRFGLSAVKDGQSRPAGGELDWAKLRVPDGADVGGNRVAEWEIPASANLAAGEYVLRATWADRSAGQLAAEARFQIAKPQNDQENAEHAERMALEAYRQRRFAETRKWAEEAVKADRQSTTPQRMEMMMAQADACLAMDDFRAGMEIYRAMLKMPVDERMAADLNGKVKFLEGLVGKRK